MITILRALLQVQPETKLFPRTLSIHGIARGSMDRPTALHGMDLCFPLHRPTDCRVTEGRPIDLHSLNGNRIYRISSVLYLSSSLRYIAE